MFAGISSLVRKRNVIEFIMRAYVVQFSAVPTIVIKSTKRKELHQIKITKIYNKNSKNCSIYNRKIFTFKNNFLLPS